MSIKFQGTIVSMYEPEFATHDIYVLNVQAESYYQFAMKNNGDPIIVDLIKELFESVPDSQEHLLEWSGPLMK